ncbi:hypothetical protein [Nocardia sp. AG03]|uniref:hypothetical protein n=1 Tax=Nocardia sp. AG03 TaxID=3025312 RepID=UPI0024181BA1|nr:hypothetical protein [Nocardia sp. AG03]
MQSNSALPERVRPFVNHVALLDEVTKYILTSAPGNRVIVLTGEPGIGKTSVGIELVHELRAYYPDGVLFLEFGGVDQVDHPEDVLGLALRRLGHPLGDIPVGRDRRDLYRTLTERGSRVIFLDGVVTEAQARALMPASGSSLVIVTEARPATPLDAVGMRAFVVDELDEVAARHLLEELIGIDTCQAEPTEFDELVGHCANVPHALRIVATMVCRSANRRVARPVAETVDRLRDPQRRRTALPLERVYGAAYGLLSVRSQQCYRALGLRAHGGRVSAEAMAAVLGVSVGVAAESLIDLADMWLLSSVEAPRYRVRELIRRHAEEVDERTMAERDADEWRLVEFYDARLAAADALIAPGRPWRRLLFGDLTPDTTLFDGVEQARAWLWEERTALLAAAEFLDSVGDDRYPQRWAVLLWAFHEQEKILGDLELLSGWGLAAAGRAGQPDVTALLHLQYGFGKLWAGDLEAAATEFEAASAAAIRADVKASALEGLGLVRLDQGRTSEALELLRENARLAREIDDPRRILIADFHLAKVESPQTALALLDTVEAGLRTLASDEADNLAKSMYWRGRKLALLGDHQRAAIELSRAYTAMEARRRSFDLGKIAEASGEVAHALGDPAGARDFLLRAVGHFEQTGLTADAANARAKIEQWGL